MHILNAHLAARGAASASGMLLALVFIASLAGCASSTTGGAYSRGETGQVEEIQFGVVDAVREVQIQGTQSGIGALSGAVVGGIGGSSIMQGKGSSITSVLGALAGGAGGAAAEEGLTRQKGYEITVRLENGRTIAVVQGGQEQFHRGDHVKLLTGAGGKTRVTHVE